jgi:two-component system, chemotaxis family, sensor histidine kinase and response regulator WspE
VSTDHSVDLTEFSMIELFRLEVENQSVVFAENLLALEHDPADASRLETLMRVAHSLKGAALMVDCEVAGRVAHELENVFVAAQEGSLVLAPEHVDVLFRSMDLIQRIAQAPEDTSGSGESEHVEEAQQFLGELAKVWAHPSEPANGSSKPRQPQEISVLDLPALIPEAEIAVNELLTDPDDGPQKTSAVFAGHAREFRPASCADRRIAGGIATASSVRGIVAASQAAA